MSSPETIYALSTARGRAAIAIVRLSGPQAGDVLKLLAGRLPAPRRAVRALLNDPDSDELLDDALVLFLPGPGSFTGEDMAELHLHGGSAIISAVLTALSRTDLCRLAEPGEFSRRGFENGKFDLTAAEGIGDLVNAETASQRRQALRQAGGAFGVTVEDWRLRLTRALAHLEAAIDFPDEELPGDVASPAIVLAKAVGAEIAHHLADGRRGEILRDGFSVAIIGPPNSGKSSLMNRLVRREAAIVSDIAGTTRDVIEAHLDLDGYAVTLADTAGLRESSDKIETEGIRRALARAENAEFRLLVLDATDHGSTAEFAIYRDERTLVLWNKADRLSAMGLTSPVDGLLISAETGEGLNELEAVIAHEVAARLYGPPALVTRERHRIALKDCAEALDRMFHVKHLGDEIAAEDLRLALRALGRITGRVDVEDLLDVIFRDFCIGK